MSSGTRQTTARAGAPVSSETTPECDECVRPSCDTLAIFILDPEGRIRNACAFDD